MTRFSVDTAALADRIAQMQRFDQTLAQHLETLDQAINRLHITWEGEAATAHRQAHSEWRKGADDMRAAVAAMRAAAQIAHDNYENAAGANVRIWQSVQ